MRDEILRSRRIGLNANRLHVKVDVPRKLYWADRLGLLIMGDVPNSWGEPDAEMRARDRVRPARHDRSATSTIPPSSPGSRSTRPGACSPSRTTSGPTCPRRRSGWPRSTAWPSSSTPPAWSRTTRPATTTTSRRTSTPGTPTCPATPGASTWTRSRSDTFPGSKWNFIGGRTQGGQPLLNSECGNVWGYEGSTGDVDWSWDYHIMMNEFRRHPQGLRLALHRAPRRHQRVERLLPLRPHRQVHRAGGARPRHEPARSARAVLHLDR